MDALQNILLKKKGEQPQYPKQKSMPNYKRKKKSESLQSIFRLPKSLLDKFRSQPEMPALKRQRSNNQRLQATIQLGNIGQQYHHNLRKTILNQTKQYLNSKPNKRANFQQNNFISKDEHGYCKSSTGDHLIFNTQYEKNMKTMNILQKAIIKEDDLFEAQQNIFELQANKLPIIRKRQCKRRKLLAEFQIRHPTFSPPHRQPIKQHKIQRKTVEPIKTVEKIEKPDIRGWDTPQFIQL